MAKKKTKKADDDRMNIVAAMHELPNMDLLRIALTGIAVLHDRAMSDNIKDGETDDKDDSKRPSKPKLLLPNSAK